MNNSHAPARTTLRNAGREAITVAVIVLGALVWTVGYCSLHGYQHAPDSWLIRSGLARNRTGDDLTTYAGIPDWVFIGIVLPWAICTFLTILLSLRGLADDDLGAEQETADPHAS
ncbi:MAG TPA: hypothetical protein VGP68_07115 [Gemmataceae bacterium]|jgi:hypothetical protein|nr:hypothetical protein [Gemmataceae bacterium]